jgi:hypothetical protein
LAGKAERDYLRGRNETLKECIYTLKKCGICITHVKPGTRISALAMPEHTAPPAVPNDQLISIANHIDGAASALPDEWQDWASELVSDLRRLAKSKAVPVVPGDAEFNAWVQRDYNREVTLSCPVNLGIAKSAWKGCCTAILEGQKE